MINNSSVIAKKTIGLIAGNGNLPLAFVQEAKKLNYKIVLVAHKNESLPNLPDFVDEYLWVKLGQLGKIITFFKKKNVEQICFLGGIKKTRIYSGFWPDLRGLKFVAKCTQRGDDQILRLLAKEFESENIKIVSCSEIVPNLLAPKGVLTSRDFTIQEREDAELAFNTSKELGKLEVGQLVVVAKGVIIAVEAIEGSDACMLRAGLLAKGSESLVVGKTSKPQQDLRFDMPTVGLKTLETMKEAGVTAMVLESKHCLIEDVEKFVIKANSYGFAIVAI